MSGIAFAFEIGGKAVDPDKIENPDEAKIIKSIMESVSERVEDLHCQVHDEGPRFVCTGDSYEDLSLEVMGCCDAFVEQVTKRMSMPE
ncbi:MAG: hypothetical protein K8H75_05595 [Sulfuricella sp.]|nr:hypothetical protein [Sulfuricella sp.]